MVDSVVIVTAVDKSLLLMLALLASCDQGFDREDGLMAESDQKFQEVVLNSDTKNACSPPLDPEEDFTGIRINAPSTVVYNPDEPAADGEFAAIPICGYYELDMGELMKDSVIRIMVKNMVTEKVYSGSLIEQDPGTEEPFPDDEPPLDPEEFAGQSIAAYFNPNLPKYVSIPVEAGTYRVYVQIGEVRSNAVEIIVVNDLVTPDP